MINFIKSIFQSEPYRFFLNPVFDQPEITFREKVQNTKVAFRFNVKLLCFWFLVFALASMIAHLFKTDSIFVGLLSRFHSFRDMPKARILLLAVLMAPIAEEIALRGFLTFRKTAVAFSLGAFTFSIGGLFFAAHSTRWIYAIAGVIVVGLALVFLDKERLNTLSLSTKKALFYFSCVLFGLLHLNNYRFDNVTIWVLAMLIFGIIPQLILSISLSYVRLKNGLIWSILYHGLYNLVTVTPLLLLQH